MTISTLENFKGNIKLQNAHPEIIQAVQLSLKYANLYDGRPDGICGVNTISAFTRFKKLEYLEYPEILGASTAKALLETFGERSAPQDNFIPKSHTKDVVIIRLPEVGIVSSKDVIPGCRHFTWGEFTKGLTRVPDTALIVRNTIKLARYLEKVRLHLGRAISVVSGYRPPTVNISVGGASNSRHKYGDAADITVSGIEPYMAYMLLNRWHNDCGGLGNGRSFTHIDLRGYAARWNYG